MYLNSLNLRKAPEKFPSALVVVLVVVVARLPGAVTRVKNPAPAEVCVWDSKVDKCLCKCACLNSALRRA